MLEPIVATKIKSLAVYFGISTPIIAYIGLDPKIMEVFCMLIVIDIILGFAISFWMSEFKSRTAQDRLARKSILLIIIGALGITGTVNEPIAFVAQTVLMAFTIAELVSVIRHCYTVWAKERLPEVDVIKIILKGAISVLEKKSQDGK